MIAIADGGSTKCDWILLDHVGKERLKTAVRGFNPNMTLPELILQALKDNVQLSLLKADVSRVFYYGAGCGTDANRTIVRESFKQYFTNAEISVRQDLIAAAYAAYDGEPVIVCILGTGSNSCFFDGKNIRTDLPSLGYLIGDEGSGNAIGKHLLRRFFMKQLPHDLHREFDEIYHLSVDEVLKNIYRNPCVNAYLGSFNQFVAERKTHPYFQEMIYQEIKCFLEYQVLPYPEAKEVEIHFVGNVAFVYESVLRQSAAGLGLRVGKVIRNPVGDLAEYHRKYIL